MAHPDIQRRFFTGVGIELMTTDGKIMLQILKKLAAAGCPALGIHDAVVCKVADVGFVRNTMTRVYRGFKKFDPVIHRVY